MTYSIRSIGAITSIDKEVDLYKMKAENANVTYRPPKMNIAIVKFPQFHSACWVSRHGKISCVGAKSIAELEALIEFVRDFAKKYALEGDKQ